jgi:hypothetical protein
MLFGKIPGGSGYLLGQIGRFKFHIRKDTYFAF